MIIRGESNLDVKSMVGRGGISDIGKVNVHQIIKLLVKCRNRHVSLLLRNSLVLKYSFSPRTFREHL